MKFFPLLGLNFILLFTIDILYSVFLFGKEGDRSWVLEELGFCLILSIVFTILKLGKDD